MPSEVQADKTLRLAKGRNRLSFRNPRGKKRYYSFYNAQFVAASSYKWSVDGIDWTNASVWTSGRNVDSMDLKVYDDGSQLVIYFVYWDESQGSIRYWRGTIADADDTVVLGGEQNVIDSLDNEMAGIHCVAIARTDNGRLVVAFTEDFRDMGKNYRQIKLIGSDDDSASPTWSGETIWDDPSTNSNNQDKDQVWFGLENFSSSYPNRVYLYARLPEATDVTTYNAVTTVPDWNGVVFSNKTQGAPSGGSGAEYGRVLSGLVDESDKTHIIHKYSNTRLEYDKSASAGDDDWSGSWGIILANNIDACTLTLDTGPATDELYAFYHDSTATADFHYKKTPVDTISWGDEQTITFASDMIALTSWNRQIEEGLHIGIEDADTDVWYHEVDVSGAPPPVGQPAIIRTQGIPTGPGARTRPGGWN